MSSWQVLLVTGGYCYYCHDVDLFDTTELLLPGSGSWRLATGLLPRPKTGVRIATLANIMYLTGMSLLF